jgi:SAM-dependent methyltransferase
MSVRTIEESVIWHDVECGGYEADLSLWAELAERSNGAVLELGCGTGRVALHLAHRGYRVTGIDIDSALVDALRSRAVESELPITAETAEATGFDLPQQFGLILAPMQLIQLLPGEAARAQCLRRIAEHLLPGGLAAFAIVDALPAAVPPSPLLPDVRERHGWVYSSLPLGAHESEGALLVERLRQTVDPGGHLRESRDVVRLQAVSAAALEDEGRRVGLGAAGRRQIAATDAHVGSTGVLLEGR